MGNTITYENNRYNPVLPHDVNGPESEANNNLLRKFIHNELMNRKEIINGNEVEINKLKVYCRNKPSMNNPSNAQTKADLNATENDTISLALPYVSNTAPIFSSTTTSNKNELKSEIKTAYVPFNYKGNNSIRITEDNNRNPTGFQKKHCRQYIGAICGKQIIDNNCIVDKNIKLDTDVASITIDPNNAKCFKEKTESGQLINEEERAYNAQQKILILKNLSDMAISGNGLLSRDFDFLGANGATREINNFDDYITTYYHLCDYLKAPWNDDVYRTGNSPAYVKLTLTANQAGEPVFKYEDNKIKMFHPNTPEGKVKIGNIYLRKDILDFNNWDITGNGGKYFRNQQNIDTVIFDSGSFHNKKTGNTYNDDSSYDMLPRTGSMTVFLTDENKAVKRRLHAYFNIRRMIILNFIYATELIVKPAGTTDKTFNSGEPLCSCVNSVYGPNLQTVTKSSCLGELSNKTDQEIKDLADTIYNPSPDKFAEEARRCLGWNVKNLTTYLIKKSGNTIVVDYNSPSNLNKPMRISYAEGLKTLGNMDVITSRINSLTWQGRAVSDDAKRLLINQMEQVFATGAIAKNQNYIIPGSKSTTVPGHNYQVKLDDSLYSVGTENNDSAKIEGGGRDFYMSAYDKDIVCENSVLNQTGNSGEQKPFYPEGLSQAADVQCINSISFNNINVDTLNIGNILQNNTCGNNGNIAQTFINQNDGGSSGENNNSLCPIAKTGIGNSFLFVSGFSVGLVIDGTPFLRYSIDSNLNGVYVLDRDASSENRDKFQIYENISNDLKIMLVISSTSKTAKAEFYVNHLGRLINILSSREFNFLQQNSTQNEELCMDKRSLSLGLLKLNINSKSNIDEGNRNIYSTNQEKETVFNNSYLKSTLLQDFNLPTFDNNVLLPDYKWSTDLEYDNASTKVDGARNNYNNFLLSQNGVITTGMNNNFTDSVTGGSYFKEGKHQAEADLLYLEEISDNLYFDTPIDIDKPKFGLTKIFTVAQNSLVAGGIVLPVDANENSEGLKWDSSTSQGDNKIFKYKTYTKDSSSVQEMNWYDFNFRAVKNNQSFICYNSTLQRYILLYKNNSEYTALAASQTTNRAFSNLPKEDKPFNERTPGKETILLSGKYLTVLPLQILKNDEEKGKFFMWQGLPIKVKTELFNQKHRDNGRRWLLRNFKYYSSQFSNLDNPNKIPEEISFNLIRNENNSSTPYKNSTETQRIFKQITDNDLYEPNKISLDALESTYQRYGRTNEERIENLRRIRFVLDMYGELSGDSGSVLPEANEPHDIKGMSYVRQSPKKYTFRRKETNKTNNFFTFENGKWVLYRPKDQLEKNIRSSNKDIVEGTLRLGNITRLYFNTLNLIGATNSIVNLKFGNDTFNLLNNWKVNITPTSEYYLEICLNAIGYSSDNIGLQNDKTQTEVEKTVKSPWKASFDRCASKLGNLSPAYTNFTNKILEIIKDEIEKYLEVLNVGNIDIVFSKSKHSSLLTDASLSFFNDGFGYRYVKDSNKLLYNLNTDENDNSLGPRIDRRLIKLQTSASIEQLEEINLHELVGKINSRIPILDLENPKILNQYLLKIGTITNSNFKFSTSTEISEDQTREINRFPYDSILTFLSSPSNDGYETIAEVKDKISLCDNTTHTKSPDDVDYMESSVSLFQDTHPFKNSKAFNMGWAQGGFKKGTVILNTTNRNLNQDDTTKKIKEAFDYALKFSFSNFGSSVKRYTQTQQFTNSSFKKNKIEPFDNYQNMFSFNLVENIDNTSGNMETYEVTYLYYTFNDDNNNPYFKPLTDDAGENIPNTAIQLSAIDTYGPISSSYKKDGILQSDFLTRGNAENAYTVLIKSFVRQVMLKLNNNLDSFSNSSGHLQIENIDDNGDKVNIYDTTNDPYLEKVRAISLKSQLKRINNQYEKTVEAIRTFKVKQINDHFTNNVYNQAIRDFFENSSTLESEKGILNLIQDIYNNKRGVTTDGTISVGSLGNSLAVASGSDTWAEMIDYDYSPEDTVNIENLTKFVNFKAVMDIIQQKMLEKGLTIIDFNNITVNERGSFDTLSKDYYQNINEIFIKETYDISFTDVQQDQFEASCRIKYNTTNPDDNNTCASFESKILVQEINKINNEIASLKELEEADRYSIRTITQDRQKFTEIKNELQRVREEIRNRPPTPPPPVGTQSTSGETQPGTLPGTQTETTGSSKKIIAIVLLILLIIGAFLVINSSGSSSNDYDYDYDYGEY